MNDNPTTGWVDPRAVGESDKAFFKAEDGKTKRIFLMTPPVHARAQFVQGAGFVHTFCQYEEVNGVQRLKEVGLDMELLGQEPQNIWMVPVCVYDTDKKGSIGNRKPENVDFEFQLWTIYPRDYGKLFDMAMEWGDEFSQKDILVTGKKNGRYINADLNVAAKNAIYLNPKLKEQIDAQFAAYKFRDVSKQIARTLTETEFRELVAKNEGETSSTASADPNALTK